MIYIWGGMKMYYNNLHWHPMPECRYPMEYHRRYCWAYPCIDYDIDDGMVCPMMYPDIYYKLYPYVRRVCDLMDNPCILYPTREQIESMVDECYDMCVREMPELEQYAGSIVPVYQEVGAQQFAFRRPILRDLIAIILISELFRRRRRRF
jgi:hypothetical protein